MTTIFAGQETVWIALALAAVATYLWRAIGVYVSGHIRVDGPVFTWVTYVAYSLLAALVSRMIVLPISPTLQDIPLAIRLGCAGLGLAAFLISRHNIPLGVAVGAGAMGLYGWFF